MGKIDEPPPREITKESDYAARPREEGITRRRALKNLALGTGSALVFGGGLYAMSSKRGRGGAPAPSAAALPSIATVRSAAPPVGPIEAPTPYEDITTYNNFYEFGLSKSEPAERSGTLITRPWTVRVEGEVQRPRTFDIDEILKTFPVEERVYRMRCVEAWSMVIPWLGFELGALLRACDPTSRAKYVAFTTLYDPKQMPGQHDGVLEWPYVEGLRIDEAMHRLTLLSIGLYGKTLPNQNGAPIRLVVPWKYGFKGIKSIVKITLTEEEPPTTWAKTAPREYGFYANVNPRVDHPRWSQATERRIGDLGKRPTLLFNGYADEVAGLYTGMDLGRYF